MDDSYRVVKPLPESNFIDHGVTEHGSNAEMRWGSMRDAPYLTSNDRFFVRSQSNTPTIDVATWTLSVEGPGVAEPKAFTYDDLMAMPSVTFTRALECAGNGRRFFERTHGRVPDGTSWLLGGVGVAEWTGVPLKTLLDQVGLKPDAHDVMVEGLDDMHVKRPIPVSKALADDTLIALKMNREPLPIDHGYPARLIVSGWAAVASIKWVGRIEVTTEASFSHWNTESYVLIGEDYPAEGEALGQIILSQTVKSALELPEPAALEPGPQRITGRAWSPNGAIEKVEWRAGPDDPWSLTRLVGENLPLAWCRFEFEWDATLGDHALEVRATDDRGNVQPDAVPWNELGYLYGAVAGHRVTVKT